MANSRKTPFSSWETTKTDGIEQRYIRMGNSQMLHPAVLNLTHSVYRIYTYMKLKSGGKRSFPFPKSKWKGFISPEGFQKAKNELCEAGLIEIEQNNANLRKANIYRFSEKWKIVK